MPSASPTEVSTSTTASFTRASASAGDADGRVVKGRFAKVVCGEIASGVTAALLVSPFIKIIDASIFANASGRQALVPAIASGLKDLLFRPAYFFKQLPFICVLGVYSATYCVANVVQAVCDHQLHVDWFWPKFIASSITNVSASVAKDAYFTRAFAKIPSPGMTISNRPVPVVSNVLYATRDSVTIFASFNLPPIVAQHLHRSMGVSQPTADTFAQLFTPCAVQFATAPLHLVGMDLYNRPNTASITTWPDRIAFVRREYVKTALARCGRIFPAYGIGGVANKALRERSHAWALDQ
ncbi:hypothetical protein HDU85_002010 [Gaertneriomyces sp. JEL0708]|nr:hypothetical protein HDU85_002010 [Gaertneriomyces sp. JEL0708]